MASNQYGIITDLTNVDTACTQTHPESRAGEFVCLTEDVSGRDTNFIRRTKSRFVQKPCSSRTLLETVRECLDEE